MPVRPATRADIPVMASVLAAAFGPDNLFRHLFPFQDQYPRDMEAAMRENLWLAFYDVKKVLMVSYEANAKADERDALLPTSTGKGPGKASAQRITGMAEWERGVRGKGAGFANGFWGWWDPRRLVKPLLSTFYRLRRFFVPNRAANRLTPTKEDPTPLTYWNFGPAIFPFIKQFMAAPHRESHWSLEILAVHPSHQAKGYGRELVQHGLEVFAKSDPEGDMPACVVAADGKEEFYRKVGFRELVGWVSRAWDENGRENPFRGIGVGGGAVLWTR